MAPVPLMVKSVGEFNVTPAGPLTTWPIIMSPAPLVPEVSATVDVLL